MKRFLILAAMVAAATTGAVATAGAAQQISLNGKWQIAFDEHNEGKRNHWEKDANLRKQKLQAIDVPASWETIRANYEGVAWYRTQFTVPAEMKGKSIRLQFGAVSYLTEVWLNGEIVDYHEGGYDPFEFTIDGLLNYDKPNVLILRVISPIVLYDDLEIDGMRKWEAPHWRGALVAGVWQDVALKATERTYVRDIFVEAALDGKVRLNVSATNAEVKNRDVTFNYTIKERDGGKTVWQSSEKRTLLPGGNDFSVAAAITSPKLWSPDAPNLYIAEANIDGKDAFPVRFGVREFTVAKDGFRLNGKKFYMKAGFWEGLYPVGLAVPDSPEMAQREIQMAKDAHFNTLRPWRKPPVPWLLDMADEMGILMIGAPALECMNEKPAIAGQLNRRVFHEIEAMVTRDRNHPSIIMWELFNEVKRDAIARLKHESSLRARAADPTRLIVDESGGWADGCKAYLPYSREFVAFNEMHSYQKAPLRESIYDIYATLASGGQKLAGWSKLTPGAVSIVSEVGYGSMPDLEEIMSEFRAKGNPLTPPYTSHEALYESMKKVMDEAGLYDVFGTMKNMVDWSQTVQSDGNKLMIEALRINSNISGYCLHAFTDGDWVIGAGVLDIWRNPKKQFYMLKQVNAPLYVSARITPANIYAGQQVSVRSAVVSELEDAVGGNLVVTLSTAKGNKLWSKTVPVTAKWGVTPAVDEKVTIPANISGGCTLSVKYLGGGKTLADNSFACNVFPEVKKGSVKAPKQLVVIDKGDLKRWLDKMGTAYIETLPESDNIVILTTVNEPDAAQSDLFRKVFEKVKRGAVVVMLNPPLKYSNYALANPPLVDSVFTRNRFYTEGIFPLDLVERSAKGNWVVNNHAVTAHPYFAGLPTKCFMGQIYANVAPLKTMMGLTQKPIVTSVSWTIKRSYLGIKEAWWGSDLTRVPYGSGAIVLSTLDVVSNLGTDPVADIIMKNMIVNTK